MGMTSMREGTTQSTKMPRGFCRVASRTGRGETEQMKRAREGGHIAGWRKKQRDISSRPRDEGKERDVCLTDGGETRCHVAFRNFGRPGTSAVFIVPFVRASFFSPPLAPLFSIHDPSPRREPAVAKAKRGSFRRSSTDALIPDRGYLFLSGTPSGEESPAEERVNPSDENKGVLSCRTDSASSPRPTRGEEHRALKLSLLSNLMISSFRSSELSSILLLSLIINTFTDEPDVPDRVRR